MVKKIMNCSLFKPALYAGLGSLWLLLSSIGVHAQWKKLPMYFQDAINVSCIYYLDSLPQIGFISVGGNIYKTTDGGYTWDTARLIGPSEASDFTFKDSLTGWTSYGLSKTTDGGNSWIFASPPGGGDDIYYDKKYDRLLMTTSNDVVGILLSTDGGKTWLLNNLDGGGTETFSFWNDDTGVAAGYAEFYLTTDGGTTWNVAGANAGDFLYQLVAIPGTTTGFAIDQFGVVRRTDDLWHSCYPVYQFPPEYNSGIGKVSSFVSSMCITGDLQNLYVTLDSGCFRSTDQGRTWKYLCGIRSPAASDVLDAHRFYAKGNKVFVSAEDTATHFWMLNVDSMQYFPTGIAFSDSTKRTTLQAGTPVTINYSPQTSDPIGIDTGHLVFHYDSNALSLQSLQLPPSWIIVDSKTSGGVLDLRIIDTTGTQLPAPAVQLTFNTYLTTPQPPPWKGGGVSGAMVYLDSADLSGHRLNCDCQALSIVGPDSVEIDFTGCGDSTILAAMQGQPPFSIESIVPNPATSMLRVEGSGQGVGVELDDAIGRTVLPSTLYALPFTLDVASLPSGIYFLRLSEGGYVQTRPVSIER